MLKFFRMKRDRVLVTMGAGAVIAALLAQSWRAFHSRHAMITRGAPLTTTVIVRALSGGVLVKARLRASQLTSSGARVQRASPNVDVTDAQGTARLTLTADDYVIEAAHAEYSPAYVYVPYNRSSAVAVEMTLVPGGTISGRILDRASGRGVPDATVTGSGELAIGSIVPGSLPAVTMTRSDGQFDLAHLRPGRIRLTASKGGLRTIESTTIPLVLGGNVTDVVVWVDRAWSVSGLVTNSSEPLEPQVDVWVYARGADTGEMIAASAASRSDGSFTIEGIPPGRYFLDFRSGDSAIRASGAVVLVRDADVVDQRLRIEAALNAPDYVSLSPITTRKGAKGPPSAMSTDGAEGGAPVHANDGDVTATARSGVICGTVVDSMGDPVASAWVSVNVASLTPDRLGELERTARRTPLSRLDMYSAFFPSSDAQVRYFPTAADGSFEGVGLSPGQYELWVYGENGKQLRWNAAERGPERESPELVTVNRAFKDDPWHALTSPTCSTRLSVGSCNATMVGVAKDEHGAPLSQAWVVAAPHPGDLADTPLGPGSATFTKEDGRFELTHLCDPPYSIVAYQLSTLALAAATFDNVSGEKVLTLREAASMDVLSHATRTSFVTYTLCKIGRAPQCTSVRAPVGPFKLNGLDPGSYRVFVQADEGYAVETVDLSPKSRRVQAVMGLAPWSSVRGQVIDSAGNDLCGLETTIYWETSATGAENDPVRTHTDAHGRFSFPRLTSGAFRLSFARCGVDRPILAASSAHGCVAPSSSSRSLACGLSDHTEVDLGKIELGDTGRKCDGVGSGLADP